MNSRPFAAPLFRRPAVRWLVLGVLFMGLNTAFLYGFVEGLGVHVFVATLFSAELCTVIRYVLNECWVFGTSRLSWRRLWQYHLANAAAFLIWLSATDLLVFARLNYLVASVLAVFASTGFSFLSNFYWVWRKSRSDAHEVGSGPREVVAGIVLLRGDGAALLQLRDDKPSIRDPGIWVIPGGHVEPGESPLEGARREFLEETSYRCPDPRPLARFSSSSLGYTDEFDLVFYWDRFDGVQNLECREGKELRFVQRREIQSLPRRDYLTKVWDLALGNSQQLHKVYPEKAQDRLLRTPWN